MLELNDAQKTSIAIIRIISCLGVYSIHNGIIADIMPGLWQEIAGYGQDGLWMFYIISGYLAMVSYSKYNNNGGAKRYYIGRIFRIVPLAWVCLLIDYCASVFVLDNHSPIDIRWMISVMFLNMIIPTSDYFTWNGMYVFGTVSNFMLFYLLVPLIYNRIKDFKSSLFLLYGGMGVCFITHFSMGRIYQHFIGGNAETLAVHGFVNVFCNFFSTGCCIFPTVTSV